MLARMNQKPSEEPSGSQFLLVETEDEEEEALPPKVAKDYNQGKGSSNNHSITAGETSYMDENPHLYGNSADMDSKESRQNTPVITKRTLS